MIGIAINQARKLWIAVISVFLLLSIAVATWLICFQTEKEIPRKGVFVTNEGVEISLIKRRMNG